MTTFLLALATVGGAMALLSVGVMLGRGRPLKGSCGSIGQETAAGDSCDGCSCTPPALDPKS